MKRRNGLAVVSIFLCMFMTGGIALADVLPYGLKIEKVLDNTVELGDLAQAPNGDLWLLEKTGTMRIFRAGVEVGSLSVTVDSSGENGLLDVAFAPDYATSGLALVYYIDASTRARVDEVRFDGSALTLGAMIMDLGTFGGNNPGGGLGVGPDGRLYVATGDMGTGNNAQDDGHVGGKVLVADLDGTNLSNYAKGIRNGRDLAIRPDTGQVYVSDRGNGHTSAYDEVNAPELNGNMGWPNETGPGGSFDEPAWSATGAGVEGLALLGGNPVYACTDVNDVRQTIMDPDGVTVVGQGPFFNPLGDRDGTPDALCPNDMNALAAGNDGALYAANTGTNPGIYRVYADTPGPREVSAPGSPFHLTVDKDGGDILLGWENLGTLDANVPTRNAGQHSTLYQVWEGTLPISAYDHTVLTDTDGLADGPARLKTAVTPGSGSHYYLVGAQGDNMEGSLGNGRPQPPDYCATIGTGHQAGNCAEKWVNPVTPSEELYLRDLNPNSPTYQQMVTLSDFRGKVVRMDISSDNCIYCKFQSQFIGPLDIDYRDRDMAFITVFTQSYGGVTPYANEAACAADVALWAGASDAAPILCDTDLNGDNHGDVSWQYWHQPDCGGTPQNFYIDQGNVIYNFTCGGELSRSSMEVKIVPEVNPETCE